MTVTGIDRTGNMGILKVYGLFRSHSGQWSAIIAGGPYDTRSGHDHRRNPERLPISSQGRADVMERACEEQRDLRLVRHADGKEYTFDRAVEIEYDDDLREQDNLDRTHADFLADTGRA